MLNRQPDTLRISDDLIGLETQHTPAFTFHHSGTTRVGFDLIGVMLAVDLDYELSGNAGEICEVRTDRMLTPKLHAEPPIAEQLPTNSLCTAAIAAKLASS